MQRRVTRVQAGGSAMHGPRLGAGGADRGVGDVGAGGAAAGAGERGRARYHAGTFVDPGWPEHVLAGDGRCALVEPAGGAGGDPDALADRDARGGHGDAAVAANTPAGDADAEPDRAAVRAGGPGGGALPPDRGAGAAGVRACNRNTPSHRGTVCCGCTEDLADGDWPVIGEGWIDTMTDPLTVSDALVTRGHAISQEDR